MTFTDRKVFVAGGSRGIGAAIVRRFAAAEAQLGCEHLVVEDYDRSQDQGTSRESVCRDH